MVSVAFDSTSAPSRAVRIGPQGPPPERERTLADQIIRWCEGTDEYAGRGLLQPDGPNEGDPWRFTAEQVRFLTFWYEIDEVGRFVFRTGVLRRMKGWGKDPFAAAICLAEFVGPCRFESFDAGLPIAKPLQTSLVRAAAVSQDQTRNLMTLFSAMVPKRMAAEHKIEFGKEIIYAHGGRSRIESKTSSARSTEGGRPTFTLRDEIQHWLSTNDGHAMAQVLARDAAKGRGGQSRVLSICNAHLPGEDSVAEREWEGWEKISTGRSKGSGLLYDALEAPADTDLIDAASLTRGLELARGDSVWVDVERLKEEIWDPNMAPSDSRRWYLDQIVAAEDAWVAPFEWDRIADPSKVVAPGEEITMGFDGGETDDHTVLVGCRVSDAHLFTLGIWEPVNKEVPHEEIDGAVRRAFTTYLVDGFYSDYHPWQSYVDSWERDLGRQVYTHASERHPFIKDLRAMAKSLTATKMVEDLHSAIVERHVSHAGDKRASQYVYNGRRRPNAHGVSVGKEHRESSRKIDWVTGAVLAHQARQDYLALPESKRRQRRSGRAMFIS